MTKDEANFVSEVAGVLGFGSSDELLAATTAHTRLMDIKLRAELEGSLAAICRFIKHDMASETIAEAVYEKFKGGEE